MTPNSEQPRVGLSIPDVMQQTGLCRQTIYNEINAGRLKSYRVGRRRLISSRALEEWVTKLERNAQ